MSLNFVNKVNILGLIVQKIISLDVNTLFYIKRIMSVTPSVAVIKLDFEKC